MPDPAPPTVLPRVYHGCTPVVYTFGSHCRFTQLLTRSVGRTRIYTNYSACRFGSGFAVCHVCSPRTFAHTFGALTLPRHFGSCRCLCVWFAARLRARVPVLGWLIATFYSVTFPPPHHPAHFTFTRLPVDIYTPPPAGLPRLPPHFADYHCGTFTFDTAHSQVCGFAVWFTFAFAVILCRLIGLPRPTSPLPPFPFALHYSPMPHAHRLRLPSLFCYGWFAFAVLPTYTFGIRILPARVLRFAFSGCLFPRSSIYLARCGYCQFSSQFTRVTDTLLRAAFNVLPLGQFAVRVPFFITTGYRTLPLPTHAFCPLPAIAVVSPCSALPVTGYVGHIYPAFVATAFGFPRAFLHAFARICGLRPFTPCGCPVCHTRCLQHAVPLTRSCYLFTFPVPLLLRVTGYTFYAPHLLLLRAHYVYDLRARLPPTRFAVTTHWVHPTRLRLPPLLPFARAFVFAYLRYVRTRLVAFAVRTALPRFAFTCYRVPTTPHVWLRHLHAAAPVFCIYTHMRLPRCVATFVRRYCTVVHSGSSHVWVTRTRRARFDARLRRCLRLPRIYCRVLLVSTLVLRDVALPLRLRLLPPHYTTLVPHPGCRLLYGYCVPGCCGFTTVTLYVSAVVITDYPFTFPSPPTLPVAVGLFARWFTFCTRCLDRLRCTLILVVAFAFCLFRHLPADHLPPPFCCTRLPYNTPVCHSSCSSYVRCYCALLRVVTPLFTTYSTHTHI